ncbi:2117_t:CDS:2, partial [Diversispora eburnea]
NTQTPTPSPDTSENTQTPTSIPDTSENTSTPTPSPDTSENTPTPTPNSTIDSMKLPFEEEYSIFSDTKILDKIMFIINSQINSNSCSISTQLESISIPSETTTIISISCSDCSVDSTVETTYKGPIATTIESESESGMYSTTTFYTTTTKYYPGYTTTYWETTNGIATPHEVYIPPSTVIVVQKVTAAYADLVVDPTSMTTLSSNAGDSINLNIWKDKLNRIIICLWAIDNKYNRNINGCHNCSLDLLVFPQSEFMTRLQEAFNAAADKPFSIENLKDFLPFWQNRLKFFQTNTKEHMNFTSPIVSPAAVQRLKGVASKHEKRFIAHSNKLDEIIDTRNMNGLGLSKCLKKIQNPNTMQIWKEEVEEYMTTVSENSTITSNIGTSTVTKQNNIK